MTAQQLKNSILQMAVQGKLVPQDKNDEPASVLLERIKAEKQALIKAGKIKKEKPLAPITEDEIPFEIPASWCWCRLIEIYDFIDYRGSTPNKISSGVPLITAKNVKKGFIDYKIQEFISEDEYKNRQSRGISKIGDILFTTEAPMGNVALADIEKFSAGQRLITLQQYTEKNELSNSLFMFFMLSDCFNAQLLENCTGTTVKGIKAEKLKKLFLPIPPLEEQKRIVAKIEELLPYIEKYDKAETKLTELNTKFPDALKKSILQEAVQGKLVPQNPDDETASVLLERIKVEKQKLIKEGKIKKEKPLAPITEEEIPFDIPESWEWVRFSSIIELQSGQDLASDQYNSENKGIPYITGASNIENGSVIINRWTENGRSFAYKGDILLTCKGTVGTMAVLQQDQVHIARQIMGIRPLNGIDTDYVKLVLETIVERLKAAAKSMIPGIARDDVLLSLIPIPPLEEQKRIVARIEELTKYCEML